MNPDDLKQLVFQSKVRVASHLKVVMDKKLKVSMTTIIDVLIKEDLPLVF